MNLDEAKESGNDFHFVPEGGRDIIIGRHFFEQEQLLLASNHC